MEIKFTLNHFKNLTRNSILYVILDLCYLLDTKSQKIIQNVFVLKTRRIKLRSF